MLLNPYKFNRNLAGCFFTSRPPMEITVVAFAHARDIFGFSSRVVPCEPTDTPRGILHRLAPAADLRAMAVAVDSEYTSLDAPVGGARELALIPPVSGG